MNPSSGFSSTGSPLNTALIRKKLSAWYRKNGRSLPWRGVADPYRIWISEVMLQQTQVETVIPYYMRWMLRFPTLAVLASADEQDVLREWEGLGYYTRARNLLRCAHVLVREYDGKLPQDVGALKALPGIGDYIAGAIASIAFQVRAPALDGNLKRVLARLAAFRLPVNDGKGAGALKQLLMTLLPEKNPGDFNQAMMDLGALVCLPRSPLCAQCPLRAHCAAYLDGSQDILPVKTRKASVPLFQVAAAVIVEDGKTLIDKRKSGGLLGGLWEFPGGKVEPGESLPEALRRELEEELGVESSIGQAFGIYKHAYSHFKVIVYVFETKIIKGEPRPLESDQIEWAVIGKLEDYPMGKVDRLIALDLQKAQAA